jgi:hypothetical protein
MRVYRSQQRLVEVVPAIAGVLDRRLAHVEALRPAAGDPQRALFDRLVAATDGRFPSLCDLARDVRFRYFEEPALRRAQVKTYVAMDRHIEALAAGVRPEERRDHLAALVACPQPMRPALLRRYQRGDARVRDVVLEVATRRYYRIRDLTGIRLVDAGQWRLAVTDYTLDGRRFHLVVAYAPAEDLAELARAVAHHLDGVDPDHRPVVDLHLWTTAAAGDVDEVSDRLRATLETEGVGRSPHRVDVTVTAQPPAGSAAAPAAEVTYHYTFRSADEGLAEEMLYRNLHPMLAKRLDLGKLCRFALTRLDSVEDVYLFHGVAKDNPKDERLFALAEVRDLTPVRDESGQDVGFPLLERILTETLAAVRRFQAHRPPERRLLENLVILHVRPPWTVPVGAWRDLAHKLAPPITGLGIERVIANVGIVEGDGGLRRVTLHVTHPGPRGVVVHQAEPDDEPFASLDEYRQRSLQTRRRGNVYPYELVRLLTPPADEPSDFPAGEFVEYDLDDDRLVPVDRPYGLNQANLVVGVIRNVTPTVPEGMERVLIAGDPSRSLGSLAEAECRRIIAAIDLAEDRRLPVEWFAVSSGARISMSSGTENMDWIGAVLRRIITFTQGGGEINLVVTGINVGAQPYWNAEATMLMHTRGILVMLPDSAMVFTGKQALVLWGGVSAEENLGIGGFERMLGPYSQAQ